MHEALSVLQDMYTTIDVVDLPRYEWLVDWDVYTLNGLIDLLLRESDILLVTVYLQEESNMSNIDEYIFRRNTILSSNSWSESR